MHERHEKKNEIPMQYKIKFVRFFVPITLMIKRKKQ